MNGIYMNIKKNPIYIFNIEEKYKIKLFFEYGRRDEITNGLAHVYEHMLISYLEDLYNDFIEEINGYVDIDLIQIEIDIVKEKKSSFLHLLINEDFNQMLKVEYYTNNLKLIDQELVLRRNDFAEKIQKGIYNNFYFDEKMKGMLDILKHPSFEAVKKNFRLFIESLGVIFINTDNINLKIINTNKKEEIQNFKEVNMNFDKVITENADLKNIILLTRVALLKIKAFKIPDDIYYIRLISLIINKRLTKLKSKSSYFEMCYTSFHRYEVYFSIVISADKSMKEPLLKALQDILLIDISNEEIKYIHEKNKVTNKEAAYKEKLVVLYKSDEFLNNIYKKTVDIRALNSLFKYLKDQMKGLLEFY